MKTLNDIIYVTLTQHRCRLTSSSTSTSSSATTTTSTSSSITSITSGSLGVLHNDPFPTQLLAVQVIHSIVCVTGVVKFNKPIPYEKRTGFNAGIR